MDQNLLDVARTVRAFLPALVGSEAAAFDEELRALLTLASSGKEVDEELLGVLLRSAAIRTWAAQVLEDEQHRPPEMQPVTERGLRPFTGTGTPADAQRYTCPVDDNYVWYRPFVGIPVRICPDHEVPLVPQ